MTVVPTCQPDGPRLRALIFARGYTIAGFSRKIGRPQSYGTIRNACSNDKPVSVELIREIARGLRVRPGGISDWTADDDDWDGPVAKIPQPKAQTTSAA